MEFDLIARIRARAASRPDVELGIGDDAAIVRVPDGLRLVLATDTLNAGVHFPAGTVPADIGWKALAVNLSDLAAMAAEPAWCTLSLSLPQADAAWLDGFLDGFLDLAARHGVALVGGDTTRGPLSVCVTAHGLVAPGRALRRGGAMAGDEVWVTGTLGDAAAALALAGTGAAAAAGPQAARELRRRLDRPEPRVGAGRALAGLASACIDVSDGLLADLGHVCAAGGVGAEVALDALPASAALIALFPQRARRALQARGGDDYELCFTAPVSRRAAIADALAGAGVAATRIGAIVAGDRVRALDAAGAEWVADRAGYQHFEG
ncbi:thiamine-phosphate kinase [Luteimonas sp. RD2P54]|uniref:Thiamine-monophosphate kinase n=1 Tax=Luteimonas endophytica TaxID=3042023 RepID=A0ABT6J6C5_9GAMM|nr:thiamine-phosphate kinase [Luteimonas endophytica]MDH5822376.1 thiamine-phosphate kinase [Luteimonas endophytica]